MQKRTYLNSSVKNGVLLRWGTPNLTVFIAPMNFYSKQGEDYKYRKLVMKALDEWSAASNGVIKFKITTVLLESQINIEWRRVDRKALGHCNYFFDGANRLYGAEVSIGLSDGLIHEKYMSEGEVYHTILHEIGHALGLGHSPYSSDIMYTPHQYGNVRLSANDKHSIKWLYKIPQGLPIKKFAQNYSMNTDTDVDLVISRADAKSEDNTSNQQKKHYPDKSELRRNLLDEAMEIGNVKKYKLSLQNIEIKEDIKKYFR